ncbi:SRPBCC family protein [Flavobacterium microcysteis]|uniref:SRPBCC family protein n=1 Tax=Flavobacterium microcysteis TaxID=2596891 RepID=A0A501Q4B9_9FLAO|nr:SRPBCC family protein [Flavobacterium microcysteis]TPD67208.1 SRPBCC family protein [Flavobacterium microcysteis]
MKYTVEIEIDKPIDRVIELFDNTDTMKQWMEGLQSVEHLSGTPGQPGAKLKLKFKMGSREFEMIETVTVRNLPDEFTGTYEANGVLNTVKNSFIKLSDTKTKYVTENEFQLKGFMKVMAFLMPGAFKKQSLKFMSAFKKFVESQN